MGTQDAAASGKPGLDFVPLLEGQRRYIRDSDLAFCHLETPVAGLEGPFSAYPSFNVPPHIIAATQEVGTRPAQRPVTIPSTAGRMGCCAPWTSWTPPP